MTGKIDFGETRAATAIGLTSLGIATAVEANAITVTTDGVWTMSATNICIAGTVETTPPVAIVR